MLKRVQDLRVAYKLTVIVVAVAIPFVAVIGLAIRERNVPYAAARNEQRGVAYLQPFDALLEHVHRHRDLTVAVLAGAQDEVALIEEVTPLVDKDFAALEALMASEGDVYGLRPQLGPIQREWAAVKLQGLGATLEASMAAHTAVAEGLRELMVTVADRSGLTLDPALDSYYLMDLAVSRIPDVMANLSLLRARDLEAHVRAPGVAQSAATVGEVGRLRRDVAALSRDMAKATGANSSLKGLDATTEAAVRASEQFLQQFEAFEAERAEAARATAALAGAGRASEVTTASARTVGEALPRSDAAVAAYTKLLDAVQTHLDRILDERASAIRQRQYLDAGIGLLGFLLACGLAFWVVRSITAPVRSMMSLFSAIGLGDFKARANVTSYDELGTLALSFNAMLDNITGLLQSRDERDQMQQSIQKLLEEVSGVGDGDLRAEAEVTADMTGAIADSFNRMIAELRKVIGQVQGATVRVSMSAQQLQMQTNELAEGSEKQAAQIIDTSVAVEEMAASISQVSENAASSAVVAEQSRVNAEHGATAVSRTIEGMGSIREQVQETAKRIKRLGESSQEVGEIVQLIGDIADRTSILALNASIQAAMAGDAGRGFAVVAEEVERLADRATEATKRIGTLIKTTQSETAEAVAAMEDMTREVVKGSALANEAGVALTEIKTVSNRLAQLIQAISDAAHQQSRGSEQVARAMSEISQYTRKTAEATKDTAESIGSLAALSGELNNSMSRFKLPSSSTGQKAA